jgi:hypothetical protein
MDRATAYGILGLQAGATKEELMAAYRRLAMEHHPDRGGNPAKFREATDAKNIILDALEGKPEPPKPPPSRSSQARPTPRPPKPPPIINKQDHTVKIIIAKLVEMKVTFDVTVLDEETILSKDRNRIISIDMGGNIIVQVWRWNGDTMIYHAYSNYKPETVIKEFLG